MSNLEFIILHHITMFAYCILMLTTIIGGMLCLVLFPSWFDTLLQLQKHVPPDPYSII
jgi:hypothetical protein